MSMDILAGAGGRIVSVAKNASAPNTKMGTADQDMPDPAKLFGALVEKPENTEAETSDKNDGGDKDDSDVVSAETPRQSPSYFIAQPLFSLAKNLSTNVDDNSALPVAAGSGAGSSLLTPSEFGDSPDVPLIADQVDAEVPAKPVVSDKPVLVPDMEKKPAAAASNENKTLTSAKAGLENTPDATVSKRAVNGASPLDAVPAERADTLDNAAVAAPSGEGSTVSDRIGVQPQQQVSRGPVLVEAKPVVTTPNAMVRIDDIQVISERSFGAVKTLQIRLDPVELGAVTARIRVVADNIEVHLIADKAHAAEALAADRSMIEKALKVAGVTDDSKITVTVAERGTVNVQQSSSGQNTAQQQAGHQSQGQQGQQGFGTQSGMDGRNGSQGGSQAQFLGGEGRQNGQSAEAERGIPDRRGVNGEPINEASIASNGRSRGLVV